MNIEKANTEATLSDQGVDFLLVTALEEERDAVLDRLPGHRKLPPFKDDIRTYFQAQLPVIFSDGETGNYRVIMMPLLGMGRLQAATATADAITRWHPRYIMLVGIAGGVAARGVSIGDILIADQIVDYELQKLTPQGPEVSWEVQRADPRLLNACRNFMGESWQELLRIKRPARSKPKRHTGPIASGDKVIAFGDILGRYREVWPKLIGVEMEAAGVATAAFQSSESPGFFMVRCVSDLADEDKGSADVQKWRSYAGDAAASFAIALLKSGPVHLMQDHSKARALLLQEIDHNIKCFSEVYHQFRSEQKKYRDTFQTDDMGGWSSEGNPLRTLTGFSPNVLSQKAWTSEMLQPSKELSQQELEAGFSFYGKMAQIVSAQEKFQRFMESKSTSSTRLVVAGNLSEDVMNKIEDVLHHHPNPLLS